RIHGRTNQQLQKLTNPLPTESRPYTAPNLSFRCSSVVDASGATAIFAKRYEYELHLTPTPP
ncbi:hypothetical protein, partial [Mesorhizobium sp. M0276]|uniref:hypothetical protein n=1 Tax=Mesorhizobium sp. M0276 TaxID=2956928 RepID=UPI003338C57D